MPAARDVILPVDQPVHIRRAEDGEIVVQRDLQRLVRHVRAIGHFDALQQPRLDELSMRRIKHGHAIRLLRVPVRMVPERESPLRHRRLQLLARRIRRIQSRLRQHRVGVRDEDRIHMAQLGDKLGDLRSVDHQQRRGVRTRRIRRHDRRLARQLIRPVTIRVRNVRHLRLVFEVFGHSQREQAITLGLFHPDIRPHRPIRENTVRVQVHGQHGPSILQLWKIDLPRRRNRRPVMRLGR